MDLQPIEEFVYSGFQSRLQQQFNCPVFMLSSTDKTRVGQRLMSGKPLEYPYITVFPTAVDDNPESYSANLISRKGLIVAVDGNGGLVHKVKLLPTLFEVEVSYVTNSFTAGAASSGVLFFLKRWRFARRNGALSFNINYGLLNPSIQVTCSPNVPITPREIATENVTEYTITTSASILGYMSEAEVTTTSVVDTVAVLEAEGLSGGQFFSFNRG